MQRIFAKQIELKPSAMATVAERRFSDAEALCSTGSNQRANGAAYLAGFVIEILLKANLVRAYPAIARKRSHEVMDAERVVWSLIWRQHDLAEMLDRMVELQAAMKDRGRRDGRDYLEELKKICATWTIYARYSSHTILMDEAKDMVERIRVLKELLK